VKAIVQLGKGMVELEKGMVEPGKGMVELLIPFTSRCKGIGQRVMLFVS
jgi:hypothetical protein